MLGGKLMLLAALSQVTSGSASPHPAALVEQLGSPRYADREAAAAALEQIGRPALVPLRKARDSRDPEIRNRAGTLAEKIETALLTLATRVQLDFHDSPLPEVARSLGSQTGFRIELYPANLPRWRQQRVSLHESGAIDFWKAIDRVCDVAGLQYNPNMHGYIGNGEPIFALTDGTSRAMTPTSDHGPFRVSLIGVEYQKRVTYAPSGVGGHVPPPPRPAVLEPEHNEASSPRLNPVTNIQFSAQLLLAAEPRLALSQVRPLQLVEAVDERGNSLIPAGEEDTVHRRYAGYFGIATSPVVQLQAHLRRPESAGDRIKKLRGFVSLSVSARRPHPLVVPLDNSTGKTFENQDHRLTVHDIRPTPTTHNVLIELSIRANDAVESSDHLQDDVFSDSFVQRTDPQHLQIEVIDASGRMVPWFQSGVDVGTSRVTLTVTNQAQPLHLKELRYYALSRAAVKIPFEFADIPMP